MKFLVSLVLLAASTASAQFFGNKQAPDGNPKSLNVTSYVDFVQEQVPLGVRLVNGAPTQVNVHLQSFEEEPFTVQYVGGSLIDPVKGKAVMNLTSVKVGTTVRYKDEFKQPLKFTTDLHEQVLNLQIALVISIANNEIVTIQAYNQPVHIVEPENSIFDPQMLFLYLFLLAGLVSTAYAVYTAWFESVMPKTRRPKPAPIMLASTSTTGLEESWIPEHHLKRPGTKSRSSSKPKAKNNAE